MTSKTISITEEIYNELIKIKGKNESFSQLFSRLLNLQKKNLKELFGSWDLSEEEKAEIWSNISNRPSRRWEKKNLGEKSIDA